MATSSSDSAFLDMVHVGERLKYEIRTSVWPPIEKTKQRDGATRLGCLSALLLTVLARVETLCALNRPIHAQAIFGGASGLVKTLVDMMLVAQDETDESAKRMLAWEKSAKLEHFRHLESCYRKATGGILLTGHALQYSAWIAENETVVLEWAIFT